MVVHNLFKLDHFQSSHIFILFYIFMSPSFFSLLTSFTSAISFNYTYFSDTNSDIICELSAQAENQVIMLRGNMQSQVSVGQATYFKPMHLWDKASRNLTNFTTHFTFVIKSPNDQIHTDGLAFFLAPYDSQLPMVKKGCSLGLAFDNQELNMDANHFVAVEFDIYRNKGWDHEHVGIDINSMKSIVNLSWPSRTAIKEGQKNEAWISYNSSSHNLSVVFTVNGDNQYRKFLSQIIDLRNVLPEWVIFGFSATTENTTTHTLCSWEFSSSLETGSNLEAPNHWKTKKFWLVMAFDAVGFVFVGGLVFVLFALWKRKRRDKECDHVRDDYTDKDFEKVTGSESLRTMNWLV